MEKIIVTEEQAKGIELYLSDKLLPPVKAWNIACITKGLSLTNIARIVEGEPYEVIRPLKVGDIIISEWGKVIQVVEKVTNDSDKLSVETVNNSDFKYTLVCKVENREDLK